MWFKKGNNKFELWFCTLHFTTQMLTFAKGKWVKPKMLRKTTWRNRKIGTMTVLRNFCKANLMQ